MGTLNPKALSPVLVTLLGALCALCSLPVVGSSFNATHSRSARSGASAFPRDVGWDVAPITVPLAG